MADQSQVYVGVAGYFGKPDHPGKVGVFRRAASGASAREKVHPMLPPSGREGMISNARLFHLSATRSAPPARGCTVLGWFSPVSFQTTTSGPEACAARVRRPAEMAK